MKILFEANTIGEVLDQMQDMLTGFNATLKKAPRNKPEADLLPEVEEELRAPWPTQGPGPQGPKTREAIVPEVSPSTSATKKPRTPKQLENDERLRQAALAKIEAKKAAKETGNVMPVVKAPKKNKTLEELREADEAAGIAQPIKPTPPPPATAESLGLDAAEVVNVRNKTITDLQEAYANGFQKEVFELLSRFGNGAKSFRELPPESFVPIREAIDNGALT